jgi:hypothetical protein
MTSIQLFFLALAAAATALFVMGYVKGTREALSTYNDDSVETDDRGDVETYWWHMGFAVVASAMVIASAGVSPAFIYLGPFLAIVTAAMIGVAFLVDTKGRP